MPKTKTPKNAKLQDLSGELLTQKVSILKPLSFWDDTEETQKAPESFRMLGFGDNEAWHTGKEGYSNLHYDNISGAMVMEFYKRSGMDYLPLDYEHNSFNPHAETAAASGWFIPEHIDGIGLYATKIKWTDKAKQMIENKEYRFFSPVVLVDADGEEHVTGLLNAALTNNPALRGLQPLVSAKIIELNSISIKNEKDNKEFSMAQLEEEKQTEKEVVKEVKELTAVIQTLLGVDSADKATGKIAALIQSNEDMKAEVDRLKKMVEEGHIAQKATDVRNQVLLAVREGKISPDKVDSTMALYSKIGKEGIEAYIQELPVKLKLNTELTPPNNIVGTSSAGLNSIELDVAKRFSMSPEQFVAHKAKVKEMRFGTSDEQEDK